MAVKIVRTAIYAAAAITVLLFFLSSRSAQTTEVPRIIAKTASEAPIEPLKPMDEYDAAVDFHNILNQEPYAPVVIFSKSYCPHCKRAKKALLEDHKIVPAPVVIELDQHPHGQELQAQMHAETGRRTVPNVLVAKISRGGADDMVALAGSGKLKAQFEAWGEGFLTVD